MKLQGLKVAFRTDASLTIGSGHVMRCLTLATHLQEEGANCLFVCREHEGHLIDLIRARGFTTHALPSGYNAKPTAQHAHEPGPKHAAWLGEEWSTDAEQTLAALTEAEIDWLVVDHYGLDARWEGVLRASTKYLMVIDDLADREHDCDILLDQNLGKDVNAYSKLVPAQCLLLLGPSYALLRPEFAQHRESSLKRREKGTLKKILISMGGVDKENHSRRIASAILSSDLDPNIKLTIVLGSKAPWRRDIECLVHQNPSRLSMLISINNMAEVLSEHDLAIGAAGGTTWERCCLGVPTIMYVIADNQVEVAKAAQKYQAAILGGSEDNVVSDIQPLLDTKVRLAASRAASRITDGMGTSRLTEKMRTFN